MKPFVIENPCSETWDAMRVENGGRARHCASCTKHVVDLARMTETEIRGLVALKPDGFCGRQTIRDGALVVRPEPARAMRTSWPIRIGLGSAVVAGALATAACEPASATGPRDPIVVVERTPEPGAPTPTPLPTPPERPEIEMGEIAAPNTFHGGQVMFAPGSGKIDKSEGAKLDDIAAALSANPWITAVAVVPHVAQNEVPAGRVQALALARAKAVADALVKRGIDAKRLRAAAPASVKPAGLERNVALFACEDNACP